MLTKYHILTQSLENRFLSVTIWIGKHHILYVKTQLIRVTDSSIKNKQTSEDHVKQCGRNILPNTSQSPYMTIIIARKQRKISSSRVELHSKLTWNLNYIVTLQQSNVQNRTYQGNKILLAVTILTKHHIILESSENPFLSDTIYLGKHHITIYTTIQLWIGHLPAINQTSVVDFREMRQYEFKTPQEISNVHCQNMHNSDRVEDNTSY